MKLEVLKFVLKPKKGFYALKIACGSEDEAGGEIVQFGHQGKFGNPLNESARAYDTDE